MDSTMVLPQYWTPVIRPEDFPDTVEGLQAYREAIAPYVLGPAYEPYMGVPGPAGLQELNGGFGLTKAQLAQKWGGYGDGSGPLGDDGRPIDLTRSSGGPQSVMVDDRLRFASRAKVRPEEAIIAYLMVNPDGTPVLPDHILRIIEGVLGRDVIEQAIEDARAGLMPPSAEQTPGQQPGVAAMPDAPSRSRWGVPTGFYDGTAAAALERAAAPAQSLEMGEVLPEHQRTPESIDWWNERVANAGRWPAPPPGPVTPVPIVTAPPIAPDPVISGPGASGAAPPQESPQSEWGFDPATGLYCNSRTGECI